MLAPGKSAGTTSEPQPVSGGRHFRVRLQIVQTDFYQRTGIRIQQGEVCAGPELLGTILRSCTCIGFHSPARRIGAISHVTGFGKGEGHTAQGALAGLEKHLRRHNVEISECECFLIGGSATSRAAYDEVVAELKKQGIVFQELDILGAYHRKIAFDPATGIVKLFRQSDAELQKESNKAFSSDRSFQCFQDPRRRIVTGASLFFRNDALLRLFKDPLLPSIFAQGNRLHVWCAGCSNGMEAYSIAMVGLDWIESHGPADKDFRILGTDISPEALSKARVGKYPVSDRNIQAHRSLFAKYTDRLDTHTVQVGEKLRKTVVFKQHDIRHGSRQHLFEAVVCDHVMQYFEPDVQVELLKGLVKAVLPGGYLFVSSPSPIVAQALSEVYRFEVLARHFYRRRV